VRLATAVLAVLLTAYTVLLTWTHWQVIPRLERLLRDERVPDEPTGGILPGSVPVEAGATFACTDCQAGYEVTAPDMLLSGSGHRHYAHTTSTCCQAPGRHRIPCQMVPILLACGAITTAEAAAVLPGEIAAWLENGGPV
jgi:hypothetical protein